MKRGILSKLHLPMHWWALSYSFFDQGYREETNIARIAGAAATERTWPLCSEVSMIQFVRTQWIMKYKTGYTEAIDKWPMHRSASNRRGHTAQRIRSVKSQKSKGQFQEPVSSYPPLRFLSWGLQAPELS